MDCIRKFGGSQTLEAIKLRSVIVAHNNACETVNGIVIGGWYRHFKGSFAKILCLARHSETNDYLVIYECLVMGNLILVIKTVFMQDLLKCFCLRLISVSIQMQIRNSDLNSSLNCLLIKN